MTKIYFLRHGETDWNVQGRFQGIEDIPLNEKGLTQAVLCGKGLKQADITFDCIVSSPLDRAYVTACTIAKEIGIEEVIRDTRLIERDFGEISGRKREERDSMLASGRDLKMEPEKEVSDRMKLLAEEYVAKGFERILFVSHGASIRALLSLYSEEGSAPATAVQKNTYFSTLTYENGDFSLEAFDVGPEELR